MKKYIYFEYHQQLIFQFVESYNLLLKSNDKRYFYKDMYVAS